jgi:hypothetical protein
MGNKSEKDDKDEIDKNEIWELMENIHKYKKDDIKKLINKYDSGNKLK